MGADVVIRPIPFGRPMLSTRERTAAAEVLDGDILTHGPRVQAFETAFAAFTGSPHAIGTATCMAALHLASLCFEIGPGDEVLVPAQTHVAGAHAVEATGATPVFVDCDPATGNLDISLLAELVSERTRGITVVHYLGRPLDMAPVMALARRHGLFVVEDCAVALGARSAGTHVGLTGDIGCFSFYPVKHITTGEGGMVVTRRDDIAERVSKQRAFGIDRSVLADRRHTGAYEIEHLGLNYRLGEVAAAIGTVQLERLPGFLAERERNFDVLYAGLSEIDGLRVLATGHDGMRRSSHYCVSAVLDEGLGDLRDTVAEQLRTAGVGTSVYYPRALPDTRFYRERYGLPAGSCPEATRISERSIAFPVGPHLAEGDAAHIVEQVARILAELHW